MAQDFVLMGGLQASNCHLSVDRIYRIYLLFLSAPLVSELQNTFLTSDEGWG